MSEEKVDLDKLVIEMVEVDWLKEAENNNKNHTPKSTAKLAKSMEQLGQITPVVCDKDGVIIAGHGRTLAARELGWEKVKATILPVDYETARRMRIADNLVVNQDYNQDALMAEIKDIGLEELETMISDDRMLDNLRIAFDPEGMMSTENLVDDLDEAVNEFAEETDDLMDEVDAKDVSLKQILGASAVKPRIARRLNIFTAMLEGRHGKGNQIENLLAHVEEEIANG